MVALAQVAQVRYTANANNILCNSQMQGAGAAALNNTQASRQSVGCNNNYNVGLVGSRTVWQPVKDFTIGAEVLASFHHSYNNGQTYTGTTGDAFKPNSVYGLKDNAIFSGLLTVRRYF
jgi:hypothetical protein